MRFICIILALFWKEPSNFGIGLVSIKNIREPSTIVSIYKDETLTAKLVDFDIYKRPNKILPFGFHPDYSLCDFICLEKTRTYYKILINDTEEGYIKNDTDKEFKSWEAKLLTTSLERKDPDSNPLRERASDNAPIIAIQKNAAFKVLEVVEIAGENWIMVRESKIEGWIKWKKNDKLLVEFLLE